MVVIGLGAKWAVLDCSVELLLDQVDLSESGTPAGRRLNPSGGVRRVARDPFGRIRRWVRKRQT